MEFSVRGVSKLPKTVEAIITALGCLPEHEIKTPVLRHNTLQTQDLENRAGNANLLPEDELS